MFLRWLHKSWKYFWGIVIALLIVIVVLGGIALGLLQLDVTQNYLADRLEKRVESTYHAELSIGEIEGFLPFSLSMRNVHLSEVDSAGPADTLASVDRLQSRIDVWGLLQNRISITGFTLERPRIWIRTDEEGNRTFLRPRDKTAPNGAGEEDSGRPWFERVEIVAPAMEISNGMLTVAPVGAKAVEDGSAEGYSLRNLNATFFVDWSDRQRYLDIEAFKAETRNLGIGNISFSGQVYSDNRFLEFNSFYFNMGDSRFILNGEVDGVNLLRPRFNEQLMAARYDLRIQSERLYPGDLHDFVRGVPESEGPFTFDIEANGTADSLRLDYASVGLGESVISMNGSLKNLLDRNALSYDLSLDELVLREQDVRKVVASLETQQYRLLESLSARGKVAGSIDSVSVDVALDGMAGRLDVRGYSQLAAPYRYEGSLNGVNMNLGYVAPAQFDTTDMSFGAKLSGSGRSLEEAAANLQAAVYDSHLDHLRIDRLEVSSDLSDGKLTADYEYRSGGESFAGSGSLALREAESALSLQGNAENIDLSRFAGSDSAVAATSLNFDYSIELQDLEPDRVYGRANLDIRPSVIGGDSVRGHQLYMDLNDADEQNRTFRLTSSLLDMNITGDIIPTRILEQARFWGPYLNHQFRAEVLMDTTAAPSVPGSVPRQSVVLEGDLTAKDLGLIRRYIPSFPVVTTDSEISFSANTDGRRLLLSAVMQADTLQYNAMKFGDSRTQMTASFRNDRSFKEFSTVDLEANVSSLNTPGVNMDSLGIDLAVKQDSVYFTQQVGSISENARFRMDVRSALGDSAITVSIREFFLGNEEYAWIDEGQPSFTYRRNGSVEFNDFSFQNREEYFRLQGTMSKNRSDSLTYVLRNISLNRISDLVKGKIDFAGVLNGTLVTRSLTSQPTIQGQLGVNRLRLNDRLVGDLSFNSRYNPEKDRFDTSIDIITDSTKYEEYLADNDGLGQNIRLDGYFLTPDPQVRQDSLFHFDAEFNQIDMWVIPLIVNNIFMEMEGQASGEGYISGNFSDFDFHADFQTQNVFAKPRFVNTNFFINGPVTLDRQQGVVLDSLDIMDTKGGTGTVWGTIDLNDFKPITYLDLTLDMNQLQFLNNEMDPDVPFYGNVSGSGVVRLTGSNNDLYMRTVDPVRITSNSEVSIPLLEETELNETGKFIRFVDSFEQPERALPEDGGTVNREQLNEEQLEQAIREMTFSERFDLDLQFEAPQNVTVRLVFDPVTGEILTAQGTGQLRINMQDQDVQMFGRYNINSGNYQFVTGEIISRRLELEPGGTIVWEGPPDNARLDISAIYGARPNIATLTSETALESQNQNGGQQVPVELIVEINGTLNSVENNYYFRLPSSLDLSSNSTLSYTINQINRDEQQKLLQATSILFTGQFIPTQGAGSPTASLSQSLTRGSTVLNPLLSNQVISPLLSNQINALLNSDVSRLDVDFNLNAYNEVDLGIALRLYNDRLILRREGQITGGGPQSTLGDRIGDLNATYRIRRGLSLTAFHRQDHVLNNLGGTGSGAGDVTPSVDGIGLESQIQFNSWKELLGRVKDTFNRIFGTKKKNEDEKEQKTTDVVNNEAKLENEK